MNREVIFVMLVLIVGGLASLTATILTLVVAILLELYPTSDGPILWDQVASRTISFAVFGLFLLLIAVNYSRQKKIR